MKKVDTKLAFDRFKPESCVFVISRSLDWKNSWMVAWYNMKCSNNPFMFAVSLWKKWNTQKLIKESKEFIIAIPNKDIEDELVFFWFSNWNKVNKFEETKLKTRKWKFVNSLLLEDATINYECKLVQEIDLGNHILFIWEVLASYMNEDKKMLFNMWKDKNWKRIFEEF